MKLGTQKNSISAVALLKLLGQRDLAVLPAVAGLMLLGSALAGGGGVSLLALFRALRAWGQRQMAIGRKISRDLSRELSRCIAEDISPAVRQISRRLSGENLTDPDGESDGAHKWLRRLRHGAMATAAVVLFRKLQVALRGYDYTLCMNSYEDKLDADLDERFRLWRTSRWGQGLPQPPAAGVWRRYLYHDLTCKENLEQIHGMLGLLSRSPREMTLDQIAEGVRRIMAMRYVTILRTNTRKYWSEAQVHDIATALATDCGLKLPLPRGGLEECVAHGLLAHLPWETPRLMQITQRAALSALRLFWHAGLSWQSRFISTPLGPLHVIDTCPAGSGKAHSRPPLLLQHGMFVTGWSMSLLGWLLSQNRRVIMPDLFDFEYGWSKSWNSSTGTPVRRITEHVDVLLCVVRDPLGTEEKGCVDLCGHSFGGLLIGSLAGRCAREGLAVRKVVLLGPGGPLTRPSKDPMTSRFFNSPLETTNLIRPKWIPQSMAQAVLKMNLGILLSPNNCNTLFGLLHKEMFGPVETTGFGAPQPTLLLWGDGDRIAWPRAAASLGKYCKKRFPRMEAFWVEGGSHNIQLDSAIAVARKMEEWLEAGDSSADPGRIARLLLAWTERPLARMVLEQADEQPTLVGSMPKRPLGHAAL